MELFYNEQIDNQTKVFKLEGEEHIHIKKVLRKKPDIKYNGAILPRAN